MLIFSHTCIFFPIHAYFNSQFLFLSQGLTKPSSLFEDIIDCSSTTAFGARALSFFRQKFTEALRISMFRRMLKFINRFSTCIFIYVTCIILHSHMRIYHRWQTNCDLSGPLLNIVKSAILCRTTLSELCADDVTPLDKVIDCMAAKNFSDKPDLTLADVLMKLSPDFATQLENEIITFKLRNISAIGSWISEAKLEGGYAFAFILLVMQSSLNISIDFLFLGGDTMKYIFLSPRFLAMVEVTTAYIFLGNQDIIKRRNVEGTKTLQSLLDERESKWNRYV